MNHDYRRATTLSLTWDDIDRDCRILAGRLPKERFAGIVAVARGGLVPAALLSRLLDIKLVETVCISSYDDRRQGGLDIVKPLAGDGAGLLVVDDLVDSGATVQAVRAMLPRAHYATLYAKPAGLALVDSHVTGVDQDVWLAFPWEVAAIP